LFCRIIFVFVLFSVLKNLEYLNEFTQKFWENLKDLEIIKHSYFEPLMASLGFLFSIQVKFYQIKKKKK
jgi:hypothetical protein